MMSFFVTIRPVTYSPAAGIERRTGAAPWIATSDLCKAAVGDGVAFARMVEAEQGRVFGFLGRMGLDALTSEDVAQEAFLRVWRNAKSFDPKRGAASAKDAQARHVRPRWHRTAARKNDSVRAVHIKSRRPH